MDARPWNVPVPNHGFGAHNPVQPVYDYYAGGNVSSEVDRSYSKRLKVDENGYLGSSDNERRLKLIRDHGGAFGNFYSENHGAGNPVYMNDWQNHGFNNPPPSLPPTPPPPMAMQHGYYMPRGGNEKMSLQANLGQPPLPTSPPPPHTLAPPPPPPHGKSSLFPVSTGPASLYPQVPLASTGFVSEVCF